MTDPPTPPPGPPPLDYRAPLEDAKSPPKGLVYGLGIPAGFIATCMIGGFCNAFSSVDRAIVAVVIALAIGSCSLQFPRAKGFGLGILITTGTCLLLVGACFAIFAVNKR